MLHNGLHVQNADGTGVTSDADARLSLAGLFGTGTVNSAIAVRAGVLPGPYFPGQIFRWSGMQVGANAGTYVLTRSQAGGTYVVSNDGFIGIGVNHPTAPTSGRRVDLIYVKQNDANAGDAASKAEYGLLVGTASATPAAPYGLLPAGALACAEVSVYAGDTAIRSDAIKNVLPYASTRGGEVLVSSQAERDALIAYASLKVYRLDKGWTEQWDGATWSAIQGIPAATAGQWINLPLYGNWKNAGGDYAPLQYRRLPGGLIVLRGRIVPTFDPLVVNQIDFMIVPPEIRPAATPVHNYHWWITAKPNTSARYMFRAFYQWRDGKIYIELPDGNENFTPGPGGFVQADGISWVLG